MSHSVPEAQRWYLQRRNWSKCVHRQMFLHSKVSLTWFFRALLLRAYRCWVTKTISICLSWKRRVSPDIPTHSRVQISPISFPRGCCRHRSYGKPAPNWLWLVTKTKKTVTVPEWGGVPTVELFSTESTSECLWGQINSVYICFHLSINMKLWWK